MGWGVARSDRSPSFSEGRLVYGRSGAFLHEWEALVIFCLARTLTFAYNRLVLLFR